MRNGSCTPRTAPNAGRSAGASRMELDGEPGTVSLRLRRLCGGDGEEAPEAMVGATIVRVCGSEDADHIHYPVHGPGIRQHHGCVGVPPVGMMKRIKALTRDEYE
jgi:hypothetical protein